MQSAYLSELVGQLAIIDKIEQLSKRYEFPKTAGSIIACDGITALWKANEGKPARCSPKHKHSDILSALNQRMAMLSITLTAKHVKGHQDNEIDYEDLDRISQLNVDMDLDAKRTLNKAEEENIDFTHHKAHPKSFKKVVINGKTINHLFTTNSYNEIANKKLMDHWIEIGRFRRDQIDDIDWIGQERAISRATSGRQIFITKWVNNWMPVGRKMQQWGLRHHGQCPFCLKEKEDINHLLRCRHQEAKHIWEEALWKFLEAMGKIGTCITALFALKQELMYWNRDIEPPDAKDLPAGLREVILAQRDLGWRSFLDGLFTIQWLSYQKEHFEETKSRRGAKSWASKAIRLCWDFNMAIWKGRNEQLHNTQRIKDMEGKGEVQKAIRNEFRIGLSRLPAYGFAYLFEMRLLTLLKKSFEYMKEWLYIVKQGRIVHRDPNKLYDDFDKKGPLRESLGLIEYSKKEEEETKQQELIEQQQFTTPN